MGAILAAPVLQLRLLFLQGLSRRSLLEEIPKDWDLVQTLLLQCDSPPNSDVPNLARSLLLPSPSPRDVVVTRTASTPSPRAKLFRLMVLRAASWASAAALVRPDSVLSWSRLPVGYSLLVGFCFNELNQKQTTQTITAPSDEVCIPAQRIFCPPWLIFLRRQIFSTKLKLDYFGVANCSNLSNTILAIANTWRCLCTPYNSALASLA
jgi:hypothetical protein